MSALGHLTMVRDRVRCDAYRAALRETVQPGDVVVDVGAGTGLLAYFALQAGAAKVYAIEMNATTLETARILAQANHLANRIVFLDGRSTDLTLPEPVDGIVSEGFGAMAIEEDCPRYIVDARARFLKPGGWMIPRTATVYIAPVEAPKLYAAQVATWSRRRYGLQWSPLLTLAANAVHHGSQLQRTAPLAAPHAIHTVEYTTWVYPRDGLCLEATHTFRCARAGVLHGLGGWFTAQLSARVSLSTAPAERPTHWGQSFFPLDEPVEVQRGDALAVQLGVRPWLQRLLWHWEVTLRRGGRSVMHELHSSARMTPISSASVQRALSEAGVP